MRLPLIYCAGAPRGGGWGGWRTFLNETASPQPCVPDPMCPRACMCRAVLRCHCGDPACGCAVCWCTVAAQGVRSAQALSRLVVLAECFVWRGCKHDEQRPKHRTGRGGVLRATVAETEIVQAGAEIEAHVCCIEPLGSGTPLCRLCVAASAVNCFQGAVPAAPLFNSLIPT